MSNGDGIYVCGVGEFASDGGPVLEANWPDSCRMDIGIFIDDNDWPGDSRMGVTLSEFHEHFQTALDWWNSAIGLRFHLTGNSATARTYVDFAALSGSTLAWSHLANNTCSDKQQRYDIRRWNKRLIEQTVAHECGHLLGLHHHSSGIMKPWIDLSIEGLANIDVQRARNLGYGAPAPPPEPSEMTAAGTFYGVDEQGQIVIEGETRITHGESWQDFIMTPQDTLGEFELKPKPDV